MPNIQVSPETRAMLADIGKKNESYDDIIKRLLDGRKVHNQEKKE